MRKDSGVVRTNYFRAFTLLVAVAAAVVVALMINVPAWAASKVFVSDVSPDGGTSVAANSDITAAFDKAMRASTIKGSTFYLKKQGSTKTIPASVSLDTNETSRTATLNPASNLEAGATYTAYIKGGRRGVKASDGGQLGGTTDSTATFANGKVTWSFTVANVPPPPPPPDTTIESGPTGTVSSDSASFSFSSSEANSSFECSLDNASFAGCTSPNDYTGLTDGSHTFKVRAKDATGNIDPTPATRTWTVDTIAPTVSSVKPTNGATDVAANTNAEATFSEAIDSSSITDQTFTLSKDGSPVASHVSYDSASKKATLNPDSNLEANTTYTATITTSVKDSVGNALAQDYTWSFKTEPAPNPNSVTATPNPLSFTSDALCFPESKFLTVTNNGPGDVTFADVSITGPDATRFSTGSQQFLANNGPFTVLAGNFFQDQVTFIPTGGPPQPRTYSATLTYKDGTGARIGSTVTLSAKTTCLVFG